MSGAPSSASGTSNLRPVLHDEQLTVYQGDCVEVMAKMPEESVHCVITSPPYFGLRSYGGDPLIRGGSKGCDHVWGSSLPWMMTGQVEQTKWKDAEAAGKGQTAGSGQFCEQCGAWKGDVGLEPVHDCLAWARREPPCSHCYVCGMRRIARGIQRVLRGDGTFWLNLGDSYARDPKKGGSGTPTGRNNRGEKYTGEKEIGALKAKDLMGVPWRVAFALQADGWYLRQDIVWSKKNPLPESVRDRCVKAHEYLFLLSKSERYHFDCEAIEELATGQSPGNIDHKYVGTGSPEHRTKEGLLKVGAKATRRKRSVWHLPLTPFKGAHFAVMPTNLVEPCVLAGCPVGGVVMDPFGGSGTVAKVAIENQRRSVLIELNESYIDIIRERNRTQMGLL